MSDETHEQRWARLGRPFSWDEARRLYYLPEWYLESVLREKLPVGLGLPTVQAVDEWIVAHPVSDVCILPTHKAFILLGYEWNSEKRTWVKP